MRDQEIELACLVEEGEDLRPMRLRYGVTRSEASRHEPLEVGLGQEDPEAAAYDDGVWSDVVSEPAGVERTRSSHLPDHLDEVQVSPPAERAAMHVIGS
jgi:hypothetical protein